MSVAGIDEAGRGTLAGPVVAAAVVFPHGGIVPELKGVNDSKKLSPAQREFLFDRILAHAAAAGVGVVDSATIDACNILQATFRAMREAISNLGVPPHHLLIDGNRYPASPIPFTTIVGGDARCFSIAAASIIAKVTRDRIMRAYDAQYPAYGFARHKGYGTREHYAALRAHGLSPIHRRTFIHLGGEPAAA